MEGAAYQSVGQQLMNRFPDSKKIIISLRGSISASHNTWSGVLWDGQTLYQAPVYQITHIVDRVGGGDSFMGYPFVKARWAGGPKPDAMISTKNLLEWAKRSHGQHP